MVLVLSHHANESQQIKREVERAVHHALPVIPFRIEDVMPTESLEYFISTPHWLDAFTPPLERHAQYLAEVIKRILEGSGAPPPAPPAPATAPPSSRRAPMGLVIGGIAVVALLAALAAYLLLRPAPSFAGAWTAGASAMQWAPTATSGYANVTLGELFAADVTSGRTTGTFNVGPDGSFTTTVTISDSGTVRRLGNALVFSSQTGAVSAVGARSNGVLLGVQGASPRIGEPWIGSADPAALGSLLYGFAGSWASDNWPVWANQTPKAQMTIAANGSYSILLTQTVQGNWSGANNRWQATAAGASDSGDYHFEGADKVVITNEFGTVTWSRSK